MISDISGMEGVLDIYGVHGYGIRRCIGSGADFFSGTDKISELGHETALYCVNIFGTL
jgi:hypothetical protein